MGSPYRPDAPRPAPELAQLAAEGERRRMQAAVEANRSRNPTRDSNLRIAIGGFRGSTLKRVILGMVTVAAVTGVGAVVMTEKGPARGGLVAMTFGATMCTFMLWVFVPPLPRERPCRQRSGGWARIRSDSSATSKSSR